MEPVYWNGQKAGTVTITKQGLYYCFLCRVRLPLGSRCHLYAYTEENSRDLGLCIPDGEEFVLQTRVPMKYFTEDKISFCLNPPKKEVFVRLCSDQPFPAMERLEEGKFVIRGTQTGIVFPVTDEP